MDWEVFNKNCQKNKYLRKQIIYSSKYFILLLIFLFIFKRSSDEYENIINFGFIIIELFRRFIWNFFRLENEHLNNCEQFRGIRYIYLKHTSTISIEHLDKITKQIQLEHFHHDKQYHSIQSFINDQN